MTDPTLAQLTAAYENTAAHNDALHARLTALTAADPVLSAHRRHVEQHRLGFGDPAFHALWLRLLEAAAARFGHPRLLEIGVFKGQVLSLWALIAKTHGLDLDLSAISPLAGQPRPRSRLANWLRYRLDRAFREQVDNGNFYAEEDYAGTIRALFARFEVRFDDVHLHRGFSTDPEILRALDDAEFHVVYVDGDHTLAGARHDFLTFGAKVPRGGWLVADDAGTDLPGTTFWKGHESVTRGTAALAGLGFRNVLNVGHNRVYERLG